MPMLGYSISIHLAFASAAVWLFFGISIFNTPFYILAEILSRSIVSGSEKLCRNELYENSRRR